MAERPPNILIYMNDQEQAQVTFPEHPCRTPNADRLAAEGVRFRQCRTPAAHCCPSRATFQTGLYPSGHGVFNNVTTSTAIHPDIYPGTPTFGQGLSEAGYDLRFSGKWHVSRDLNPSDHGWQELGAQASGRKWHDTQWQRWHDQLERGANQPRERGRGELWRPGWGMYQHYGTKEGVPEHPYDPSDYRIVTNGLGGLQQALQGNTPWCSFIGPNGPHDPYIITEKYATMYDPADVVMPESWRDDLSDRPVVYQRQRLYWDQLSLDEQREAVAHYWGYCSMQDDLLGLVMDELDRSGQAEDTLILFMSDHGDYNGAHGLWMKGVPAFDEAYHIPCIARWPNGIANPGREVDEFITLADFAPTFLDLAGSQPFEKCHGRSLRPFFQDSRPDDWPDTCCTQFNGVELYYSQRSVMTRDWKYVFNGFDWDELYHLAADPCEQHNLAPRPGSPRPESAEVIEELCGRLWRFSEATNDFNGNPYGTVALCPFGPMTGLA